VTNLFEEKCEEFKNIVRPEVESINVVVDTPKDEKKKNLLILYSTR
jgi:hypothetical protein